MLYLRVAVAAVVVLSLGGCSFFGFRNEPEVPKVDQRRTVRPLEGTQLAALPGYLSDQDVAPSRIEAIGDFIVSPSIRPTAAVRVRPIERELTLKDLLPRRQVLDHRPVVTAIAPGSHSLADLIADRDWRKRTSETLNRLFQ